MADRGRPAGRDRRATAVRVRSSSPAWAAPAAAAPCSSRLDCPVPVVAWPGPAAARLGRRAGPGRRGARRPGRDPGDAVRGRRGGAPRVPGWYGRRPPGSTLVAEHAAGRDGRLHLPSATARPDAAGLPRGRLAVPVLDRADRGRSRRRLRRGAVALLADELDALASGCGPAVDSVDNPAKKLALELAGTLPYVWGGQRPGRPWPRPRGARQLAENAKHPPSAVPLTEATTTRSWCLPGRYGALRPLTPATCSATGSTTRPGGAAGPDRSCCVTPTSCPRSRARADAHAPARRAVRRPADAASCGRSGRAPA